MRLNRITAWRSHAPMVDVDFSPRPEADGLDVLLDRRADQAAPLGPGAVVVADVRVAEQLGQHEPGVRRPLPDPAVGDDRLVGGNALTTVDLLQLAGRLEGAVGVGGRRPGNALRARHVPGSLGPLLL